MTKLNYEELIEVRVAMKMHMNNINDSAAEAMDKINKMEKNNPDYNFWLKQAEETTTDYMKLKNIYEKLIEMTIEAKNEE